MNTYKSLILVILTSLLLFSCSNFQSDQLLNEKDILKANNNQYEIQNSNEFNYLSSSSEIVDSSDAFTQVKAFIPDESYTQEILVQNESFVYLKVPINANSITGQVVYENATKEPMKVRSFFMQGNNVANVKLSDSTDWKSSIEYEVAANSSVSLNVEIKWENTGMQELTFFPLDQTSEANRYEGGSLSTYRFYVQSKDVDISEELLESQSTDLTMNDIEEEANFFPVPSWLNTDKEPVEYDLVDNQLIAKESIEFLELAKIPYNTSVDILILDDFGNVNLLKDDVSISKNEKTILELSKFEIEESTQNESRKFLLITNNREEEILADLKALDLKQKPFFTSYQGLIELFPSAE